MLENDNNDMHLIRGLSEAGAGDKALNRRAGTEIRSLEESKEGKTEEVAMKSKLLTLGDDQDEKHKTAEVKDVEEGKDAMKSGERGDAGVAKEKEADDTGDQEFPKDRRES